MEIENVQKGQLIFHTVNNTQHICQPGQKQAKIQVRGEEEEEEEPIEKRSRPSAKGERKFPTQQQVELC